MSATTGIEDLSESQKTCLRLVAQGMSSKEIAIQTGLSYRTVDQYINRAALSLGASNRREAARLLVDGENTPLNKLQLQSPAIVENDSSGILDPSDEDGEQAGRKYKLLTWVPPVGGKRHELNASDTIKQIIKAALFAAVGFGAIVTTGTWLHTLFS